MARQVGTSFSGATIPETGKGSSIFTRFFRAVIDDLSLIYDKVTGGHSISASLTINHSGGGRGAPIAIPIACQEIQRSISLVGAKSPADTYIIAVPIFIPDNGQQLYRLEVDVLRRGPETPMYVEVRDSSWTISLGPSVGVVDDSGETTAWNLALGAGLQYLMVRRLPVSEDEDSSKLLRWRLTPVVSTTRGGMDAINGAVTGNPADVAASIAAADWIDFYEAQFFDLGPVDPFVLTRANRQASGLLEYVLGGAFPGNNTRTVTQEWRNNKAVFTSEPELEFPLVCMALGAIEASGGVTTDDPATIGMVDWFAPYITTGVTAANEKVVEVPVMPPRFNSGTSKLKAVVLASSTTGTPTGFSAEVRTTSTPGNFVNIGGNFYAAEVTDIPFTPGSILLADVFISSSTSATHGELNVLGVVLFFDP